MKEVKSQMTAACKSTKPVNVESGCLGMKLH